MLALSRGPTQLYQSPTGVQINMKLKIISSTIAMLGASFMLSACVPTTPTPVPTTGAPTTTAPSANPAQVTGLKLDRVELIDSNTHNAFFSWDASITPNVKYCVATTAEGTSGEVEGGCTWDNKYLSADTQQGFGLVFKENTNYKVSVTTLDSNNRKSSVSSLSWKVPTNVAIPTKLKLDKVEQVFGDTYNVFFKWNASTTPNVKYCVSTTSVGIDSPTFDNNFDSNCTFDNPNISSTTNTGFGLVFDKNYIYNFRVTAIDSSNQKSMTSTIIWQLP